MTEIQRNVLDDAPGNVNSAADDALIRSIHPAPTFPIREAMYFGSYMDAPHIVDWLATHGVAAGYGQRWGEGVTITFGAHRAHVGHHIIVRSHGDAIPATPTGGGPT